MPVKRPEKEGETKDDPSSEVTWSRSLSLWLAGVFPQDNALLQGYQRSLRFFWYKFVK